jgi:hypothetical protein
MDAVVTRGCPRTCVGASRVSPRPSWCSASFSPVVGAADVRTVMCTRCAQNWTTRRNTGALDGRGGREVQIAGHATDGTPLPGRLGAVLTPWRRLRVGSNPTPGTECELEVWGLGRLLAGSDRGSMCTRCALIVCEVAKLGPRRRSCPSTWARVTRFLRCCWRTPPSSNGATVVVVTRSVRPGRGSRSRAP